MSIPSKITLNYLEKLDKGLIKNSVDKIVMMPDLTNYRVFKMLFKFNEKMFKRFLVSVLHFEFKPENVNLIYLDKEILDPKPKTHGSTYDYYININNNIYVDLEVNKKEFDLYKDKSFFYQVKQISSSLNIVENYEDFEKKTYIQLNLNASDKTAFGEDIVCPYSIVTKSVYLTNVMTYLRYLDYYRNLYYNKFIDKEESDYWLAMLTAKSFTEIYKILSSFLDEKDRDEIIRDVINLSMDALFNEQELDNLRKQVEMDKEKFYTKKGIEQGIEQGAKENTILIAKSMLKENMPLDLITKFTGLSTEELEKLQ